MSARDSRDRPPYGPNDVFGGKYAIRSVLGEGGMAVVYAAVDTSCNRQVAIKVLRPSTISRRSVSSSRMQREAATVVQLSERSQHFVDVLTAGISEDKHRLPYYVMERLWGRTLRDMIESKRGEGQHLEVIEIASMAIEIANALALAHEMGIVHRDVKPENVYYAQQRDGSYIVKLLDFGISALLIEEPGTPRKREFSGSRPYASPEQLDGKQPTPADDVYALGLTLFEMLTFTLPHDRMNPRLSVAETALNVLRSPVPPLPSERSDMPPRLTSLVRACLAYDPERRPQALQVARTLREIKNLCERGLLGPEPDTNVTDVSGPPIEVLAQRLANAPNTQATRVQRVGGAGPVDLLASTDPPADAPDATGEVRQSEVFFWEPMRPVDAVVAGPVSPMPATDRDLPIDHSPVDAKPVLILGSPANTRPPPAPPDKKITLRMSAPPPQKSSEPAPMVASLGAVPDAHVDPRSAKPSKPPETTKVYLDAESARSLLEPLALTKRTQNVADPPSSSPPPPREISKATGGAARPLSLAVPAGAEKTAHSFGSGTLSEPVGSSSRRRSAVLLLAAAAVFGLGVAGAAAHAFRTSDTAPVPSAQAVTLASTSSPPAPQQSTNAATAAAPASVPDVQQPRAISASAHPPVTAATTSSIGHRQPPRTPLVTSAPLADLFDDGPQPPRTGAPPATAAATAPPKAAASTTATPIDSEFKTTF